MDGLGPHRGPRDVEGHGEGEGDLPDAGVVEELHEGCVLGVGDGALGEAAGRRNVESVE